MPTSPAPLAERSLPLRERKKLRARRELVETALRLFLDRGFDETTLNDLTEAADVSLRTFFRMFPSKEAVALAAESELWDAYLEQFARYDIDGTVLDALRDTLVTTIANMGEDWTRRFLATRGLVARTPALRDHSDLTSITVQRRLVEILETKLDTDSRTDVRLRQLGEIALASWRCAAKNWIRDNPGPRGGKAKVARLAREVREAFDAIPACITLRP
ncbi:MAG: TetR family transcriptional regulator [Pseudonocardiaceae bacterium]|nr:TetR family transcriptional regulator [Pseudonocardiaceae bacterium]